MDLKEIKAFLSQNRDNEDVKALIAEFSPSLDLATVQTFLQSSDEGVKWLQAEKDRFVSKGIETWKTNNMDRLKQEIQNEINPPKTDTEKRLAALELELEQARKERQRESLKNFAFKEATAKGLPVELLDFLIGEDQTATQANLATLENVWEGQKTKMAKETFKENGREPYKNPKDFGYTGKNPWSKETLNLTEQGRILRENPQLAETLKSLAK